MEVILSNGRAPSPEPAASCMGVRSARCCRDVRGLGTLGTLDDLELHTLAFGEGLEAVHRDRGEVDEHVVTTLALDEAVALLVRKPLDGALLHVLSSYKRRRRPHRADADEYLTRGTVAPTSPGLQGRAA